MRLNHETSQLLIVDMQEKFLHLVLDHTRVEERCIRLIKSARRLDIPIMFSEQYPERLGPTLSALTEEAGPDARAMAKMHFSCLGDEVLSEQLHFHRKKGRGQVVVAGIETHVCVAQTVMDLETQGFEAYVVADAVSSREEDSWDLALDRLARCGAEIVDSEMVMFEWLEKAGTPEFKDLQMLIK